jgi:hypothetical protein
MTISAHASGTQTATISTEHFLTSPNVEGKFTGVIDLSNLADGDILELRAYQMVLTGGTARVIDVQYFYGAQPTDQLIVEWGKDIKNELAESNAVRYSLKQTAGTGRDFPWKVIKETSAAGSGATAQEVWEYETRSLTDKSGFSLSSAGVQAIWDALTSALTTVGSIGKLIVDMLDAAISSRSTYGGSDTSGTTTLLSRLTSTRAGNLDNLDTTISSRLADADYTAPDNAAIANIELIAAGIETVTDQLVDAQPEPTTAPAANATPLQKLAYLFAALRNKMTVTSSSKTFYRDDGSTLWSKSVSDDGTTYTENEGS